MPPAMIGRGVTLTVCVTAWLLTASAPSLWGQPDAAPAPGYTAAQAKRGSVLYGDHCASCHGSSLEGGTAPALSGPEFLKVWSGRTYGDFFEKIRTTMPPDGAASMNRQDTADLIAFKLSVEQRAAGDVEVPPDAAALRKVQISR